MMSFDEKCAHIQLIHTPTIGVLTYNNLIGSFDSARAALHALPDIAKNSSRKKPLSIFPKNSAEAIIEKIEQFGATIIMRGDPYYPQPLSFIEDAPVYLSAKGRLDLLDKPSFAIVGARGASMAAKKLTENLAHEIGAAGYAITSGLARGIDRHAHLGAMGTGTIGVVAGGIDVVYPHDNRDIHERMFDDGLVLSEHPIATKPRAQDFPRRNRIVSGLSLGTLIVEATLRSGSLITARLAAEQGREVFAVPGFPMEQRAAGPNKLLRDGATLVERADDILNVIRHLHDIRPSQPKHKKQASLFQYAEPNKVTAPQTDTIKTSYKHPANDLKTEILDATSITATDIDLILRTIGCDSKTGLSAILDLELSGEITRHPGNKISKQG